MTEKTTTPELDRLEKERDAAYAEVEARPGDFAALDRWVKIDTLLSRKAREHLAALKAAKR